VRRAVPSGIFALAAGLLACAAAEAPPAALDTKNDVCRFCRMPVSDPRLAGQVASPGEEPKFFDDLGCLRDFLRQAGPLPSGSVVYVADHRTGNWIRASKAVFSRCPSQETPMGSHLIAHADLASQRLDAAVSGCVVAPPADVLGPAGPSRPEKKG
jgi:copper chaperone NosL